MSESVDLDKDGQFNLVDADPRELAQLIHDTIRNDVASVNLMIHGLMINPIIKEKAGPTLELIREVVSEMAIKFFHLEESLCPEVLTHFGFEKGIEEICKVRVSLTENCELAIDISDSFENLPDDVQTNLFIIAWEALNNIQKHSKPYKVVISGTSEDESDSIKNYALSIIDYYEFEDEFDLDLEGFSKINGKGLKGMNKRAEKINAEFEIHAFAGETGVHVKYRSKQSYDDYVILS